MEKYKNVSRSVITRLPRYYRFLAELEKNDVERTSSGHLAESMHLTASQIRQDLSCFGGFGQQGYGYNVKALRHEIGRILGLDEILPVILVGVGNLGHTLAHNMDFEKCGFKLTGLFDCNQDLIGKEIEGLEVLPVEKMESFCKEHHPVAAVLCIPREVAHSTAELLINCGITKFWNFSHYDLRLDFPNITVENVHLDDSLMTLRYFMKE